MFRGEIPLSPVKPDCPAMTQPSIPEPLAPAEGAVIQGAPRLAWAKAVPAQGAMAQVEHYEVDVDGAVGKTRALELTPVVKAGAHTWRVRAVNTLGNASGWSLRADFTVRP